MKTVLVAVVSALVSLGGTYALVGKATPGAAKAPAEAKDEAIDYYNCTPEQKARLVEADGRRADEIGDRIREAEHKAAEEAQAKEARWSKAVTPEQAARLLGQQATVKMRVVSAGKTRSGNGGFLNYRPYKKGIKAFTVFLRNLDEVGQPSSFLRKTILVTGDVVEYRGSPEIIVESPDQIKVLAEAK
jgi:hypothetical protein